MKFSWKRKSLLRSSELSAQGQLLDLVENKLSPLQSRSIQIEIDKSAKLAQLKSFLENGKKEIEKFEDLSVPVTLIKKISGSMSLSDRLQEQFRTGDWPTGLKWATEGFLLIAVLIFTINIIPWNNFFDIVWKKQAKTILFKDSSSVETLAAREVKVQGESKSLTFPDEGVKNTTTTLAVSAATPAPAPTTTTTTLVVTQVTAPTATQVSANAKSLQGFVYRGVLKTTNVRAITAKIVSSIDSMGARKAGEVRLGWPKGSGSYFHFTIPDQQFENAKKTFESFGTLQLAKEKHDRVMPVGISRVIIDVVEIAP